MDLSSLPFQSILLVFSIASFIFFLYRLLSTRSNKSMPPVAGGARPLIGHLHLLGGPQPMHITLGNLADRLGPIFTIKLGVHRAIVVSSSELARECFSTHDKVFASRPKGLATEILGYNYAIFGFSPYGDYWRQARKITTIELLSNHRIRKLTHVRESEMSAAVKDIHQLWLNNKTSSSQNDAVRLDIRNWFLSLSLNVMFRIIVGKRFAGTTTGEGEENKGRRAMRRFFELIWKVVVSDVFPMLRWMDVGGNEKAMKKAAAELDEVFEEWLEEHKNKRKVGSDEDREDEDFMDVMLSLNDHEAKELPDGHDFNTFNKATCLGLILAGYESTTKTLTYALSLLLNQRDVLKKAQQELDIHVGRERPVQESDIPNLGYLQAIIKETLRLYPPGPISFPRESTEDCILHGYHVPAGTRLFVNISKIQRDPSNWTNPSEFQPDRFMTTNKDFDMRGQNFEFIPFSSGRRMCSGTTLALNVMHLSLAKLLHGFDIETPFGAAVDIGESTGSTPLEVLLSPRLPTELYI